MANGKVIIDVGLDDEKVTKGIGDIGKSFTKIGGLATAAFSAIGLAGVGAINSIVEASAELNTDLTRLATNAAVQGFNLDVVTNEFKKVGAVSGELDSAVETVSNLMQTDFSENQLGEAIEYVNAGAIAFSDTLKTEGIADALQETFATGKAVGQFGELLERSGVNLDDFNAGLASAEKNGTATNYVLEQLANTGLKATYDEYLENNKAITEYNEAQVESQLKMAELGKALTPLATNFLNFKNTLIDVALGNKSVGEAFKETVNNFSVMTKTLGDKGKEVIPTLVKSIVDKLPDIISTGTEMISKLGDGISKKLPELMERGKEMVDKFGSGLVSNLPQILEAGINLVRGLVEGITKSLPTIVTAALNLVKNLAIGIIKNLPTIITAGVNLVVALIKGLLEAIPKVVSFVIKDFIPSIVNTIKAQDWKQVGKDIINGLVEGLKAVGSSAVKAITGIASDMIEGAKQILGIHSPSREFREIGLWTGEGMIVGLNDSSPRVNKAMNGILDGILDASKDFQKEYEQLIKENATKTSKANDAAAKKIASIEAAAAKKKRSLTKSELAEIQKLRNQADATRYTDKYKNDKKYQALVDASEKEYLEVVKNYIDDKKSLDELSLVEESRIWEKSIELFVVGSTQRIKAQREYQKTLEEINKQIADINKTYTEAALEVDKKYLEDTTKLNESFENAWNDRFKSLSSFASTFSEFVLDFGVTGDQLTENLRDQVWAFRNWDEYLSKVSAKGLNDSIVDELRKLGPSALPQLVALNRMTEEQLTEYNNLYVEKQKLITDEVDEEMSVLKSNTEAQLRALKTINEGELASIRDNWKEQINNIVGNTRQSFSSMQQIGVDAGRGLLNGLSSMQTPLVNKAKDIADSIQKTLNKAFEVKDNSKSTSTNKSASITNPLKNATIGIGVANMPSNNTLSNISGVGNNSTKLDIAPADVILDKDKVGSIIYKEVDKNQYRSASITAYSQGVTLQT